MYVEDAEGPSGLVRQDEVGKALGGLPWRFCRQLLEAGGVEVLSDGARRWRVRRVDWLRFLDGWRRQAVAQ